MLHRVPPNAIAARLRTGFAAIRAELEIVAEHPADAAHEAEARRAAPTAPLPGVELVGADSRTDRRDLQLVTLDPAGSTDLDQAFALHRDGAGFVLHYAIADVAAHVVPGGALDRVAHARGQTLYAPDGREGLHAPALSEDAGSLLAGVDRLAVLWTLTIDDRGELAGTEVERAVVRSTAQLDYAGAQVALDSGGAHEQLTLLREAGALLQTAQRRRGAIELPEPAQELVPDGANGWTLRWEPRHPIEAANAQLSLLCGHAAATLMLGGGTGLLRTLPPAPPEAHTRLRAAAHALRIAWPGAQPLSDLMPALDGTNPAHLAFLDECRGLLRGADYTPFDVRIQEPPILARCTGDGLRAGERQDVVLAEADPARRMVRFSV